MGPAPRPAPGWDDYDDHGDYGDWVEEEPVPRPRPGGEPPEGPRRLARKRNILWRWRRGLFVAALVVMAMVAAGVSVVAQTELPAADEMQLSSFICSAEVNEPFTCSRGNALAKLSGEGDSEYVRLADVPQPVIDAVIAAEDRDFFEHDGISPVGIARALYRDLRGGHLSQGGSTITQQLVKNAYLSPERTITRKIREAVLAIKVEQQMSKEEILERYLNVVYFGRNAYGIAAASRAYFNMDITDERFGLPHASYLAGLIRAPGLADAGDPAHPEQLEEATRRRQTVLDAMLEEEYIDEAESEMVEAMDLASYVTPKQNYRITTSFWGGSGAENYGTDYINDHVQGRAVRILMDQYGYDRESAREELATGGYRIYTTINRDMQAAAYNAVYRNTLVNPASDPAAGLVAVDDRGMVRAMVGGRDFYADNEYAQINFAVMGEGGRQVGSTFKPIALAAAALRDASFEQSSIPAPSEVDMPSIPGCDAYTFSNYRSEDADTGRLDLLQATAESSNTAFVQLMYELGSEPVLTTARQLGMDSLFEADGQPEEGAECLPTVLGAGESSPLEMAEVYSTFANRGVHKEPTIITRIEKVESGGDTSVIWEWQPNEERVLLEHHADLVTYALQGVIDHGTGEGAAIGRDAAGKTGTTSDNKDAWFVGYVPRLTAAVWMGYPLANWVDEANCDPSLPRDDPVNFPDGCYPQLRPMRDLYGYNTITGGSLPAKIWADFMGTATANMNDEFAEPTSEELQGGERLGEDLPGGGGGDDEQPVDTLPPSPPPSDPNFPPTSRPNVTVTLPTSTIPDTTTTSTTFPWQTTTTLPGGGGGGGGGGDD